MIFVFFFFFQAEDGIRDDLVTGVQTCALPICGGTGSAVTRRDPVRRFRKAGGGSRERSAIRTVPERIRRPVHLASDSNFFREWPGTSRRPDAIALSGSA